MSFKSTTKVVPSVRREMTVRDKAFSGDMVLVCTPATLATSAAIVIAAVAGAGLKYTRYVTVSLQTAAGEIHSWFNGDIGLTIAETTNGNGTANIVGTVNHVHLVDGSATIGVEYKLTWRVADDSTLTATGETILGYVVASATSVDTLAV